MVYSDILSFNSLINGYIKHGKLRDALYLFTELQRDKHNTVKPNGHTFVALLRACAKLHDLRSGMQIHEVISEKAEITSDGFIGNALLDMYAKCGSVDKAKQVFDNLLVRDVVSWTSLISGYSQHGHAEEALQCFNQMQSEGIEPNSITFVAILKAYANIRLIGKVEEIHDLAERKGVLAKSVMVGNTLVDIYAKFGWLTKAQEVFDKLSFRNVVSWTVLIAGYAEHGYGKEALKYLDEMYLEGTSPDSYTFVSSLKASGSLRVIEKGQEIHAEVERRGLLQNDPFIGNALVDMYAKCGFLAKAQEVFDKIPTPAVVSWTTLICGYAEYGHNEEALICLYKMQCKGISPNVVTYVFALKACSNIRDMLKGQEIHTAITKRMVFCQQDDLALGNSLVDMYAKCGYLAEAQEVFDGLPFQDSILFTTLIAGYTEHGRGEEALRILEAMENCGILPDSVTLICCLRSCASIGSIEKARELHSYIKRHGFMEVDLTIGDALIDMYAKCGLLEEAQKVFDGIRSGSCVAWNVLIAGYAEHGLGEVALKWFDRMQLEGILMDYGTYIPALKSCASLGLAKKGREIHAKIQATGLLEIDFIVGNLLVDMYAKSGFLVEAKNVFDELPSKDVVSWSALIAGYAEHGHSEEALNCFESMQMEDDVFPNAITLVFSLKACSTLGAIVKGQEIHTHIEKRGFTGGNLNVGNTIVDMYATCGWLEEAQEVFDMLPSRDVVSWTALIAGYTDHGRSVKALECVNKMKHEGIFLNSVTMVCILKTCGNMRAVEKGQEIHSEIERKGLFDVRDSLIEMYAKCGLLADARDVLEKLSNRSTYVWNSLLVGYTECENDWEALKCFEQMKQEGVPPDTLSFICILKSSGRIAAMDIGHQVHCEIERKGILLESNLVLGNALIGFYTKGGLLVTAKKVFERLPTRDIVSWNVLIAGYAEHGHGHESLNLSKQMELLDGLSPDPITLVLASKACSSIRSMEMSREMHGDIERNGLLQRNEFCQTRSAVPRNSLIRMYARCGLLMNAREVFDKTPLQDVVSWTSLLEGYVEQDCSEEAIRCLEKMQLEGIRPDSVTYICMLKACGRIGAIGKGREIHVEIIRKGFLDENIALGNSLVDMYAKCGSLTEARRVLEKLLVKNVVSWNSILSGHAQYGESENVFHSFDRMVGEGVKPDCVTFIILLNTCSRTGLFDKSQTYYDAMSKEHGLSPTLEHLIGMVGSLCRVGQLDNAIAMMHKTQFYPTPEMWRIVLCACKNWGNVELGKQAFEHTKRV